MTANKGQDEGKRSSVPEATHEIIEKDHSNHNTESCEIKEETSVTHPTSDSTEPMPNSSYSSVYNTNTLDSADSSKLAASYSVKNKEEVAVRGTSVDQDVRNEEHLHNIESGDNCRHQQIGNSWKHVVSLKPENDSSDCLKEEENIGNKTVGNYQC